MATGMKYNLIVEMFLVYKIVGIYQRHEYFGNVHFIFSCNLFPTQSGNFENWLRPCVESKYSIWVHLHYANFIWICIVYVHKPVYWNRYYNTNMGKPIKVSAAVMLSFSYWNLCFSFSVSHLVLVCVTSWISFSLNKRNWR